MGLYAYGRMLFLTHTDTIIVIMKNLPHPQYLVYHAYGTRLSI